MTPSNPTFIQILGVIIMAFGSFFLGALVYKLGEAKKRLMSNSKYLIDLIGGILHVKILPAAKELLEAKDNPEVFALCEKIHGDHFRLIQVRVQELPILDKDKDEVRDKIHKLFVNYVINMMFQVHLKFNNKTAPDSFCTDRTDLVRLKLNDLFKIH